MTVGELKEMLSSEPDEVHVGIVFQTNPYYEPRVDNLEPAWHIYLSIGGVLVQMN